MLKVGIHEDLGINKVSKNDRGTLVLNVKSFANAGADALLAALNDSSDDSATDSNDQDFLFYPPQATDRNNNLDTPENNQKKIKQLKDQLTHILLSYMTKDKIRWAILVDTGIDDTNINDKFQDQGTLDKIYSNMADQFTAMITPFMGGEKKNLRRWLFVRQSKAKHYAALRKSFLNENPFIESMDIPKEASKLKYTEWEVKNEFNSSKEFVADPLATDGGIESAFNS